MSVDKTIQILNGYNIDIIDKIFFVNNGKRDVDFIYADCIYESDFFDWAYCCRDVLNDTGVFIIQTDYHTVAEWKIHLDNLFGKNNFINWLIYINDWGGVPRNRFAQKHDDILIYSKGKDYKFYSDRIQIPKVTAGTVFDKKGTGTKTPCSVFYDKASFSTIAKERVKFNGKNIPWQKPRWLLERLLLPFTDEKDLVLDPFMGSGVLGKLCKELNRRYIGIEIDKEIYKVAEKTIFGENPR